jgi:hypothetical protein
MVEHMENSQKCRWMDGWFITNWKNGESSRVCTSVINEKTVENPFK